MSSDHIDIVLVEDNDDDIVMIQSLFEDTDGCRVSHVVKDGEALLDYMRQAVENSATPQPDLILLDINMPKMNGFEVLATLKGDRCLRHWPVIILTTSRREEEILEAYERGACAFITKPTDYFVFGELIKRFVDYWTRVAVIPTTTKGEQP